MSGTIKQHPPLYQFPLENDSLKIGGMALGRLATQVGRTPFYVYDRNRISARITSLRQHLPVGIHIHYAIKANPMPAVVQHLAGLVDGLDVASGGELKTALDTPIGRDRISFAGPGKSDAELSSAVAAGVLVNLESEAEMGRIAAIGVKLGVRPRVAVRVNPDFELRQAGMRMGGGARQFGVDVERVPVMLGLIARLGLDFHGFHIYSGSQMLNSGAIMDAHRQVLELALNLAQYSPVPVRLLNIGGGFGIPYFPGEAPLDLVSIAANLQQLLPEARSRLPQAQVVIELGRYLVGEAGVYVCRVIDRKVSRGKVFLVTDGGMHHHLAASGNLGQVIRRNYPVVIGNRVHGEPRERVSVVGPLCTPLDLLADDMEMARAEPGDLVAVLQSGAYGASASPAAFLSHPHALEVLV